MSYVQDDLRSQIVRLDDPDASDYQVPCPGCVGFCLEERRVDGNSDDPDDFVIENVNCPGRTEKRMTTAWRATRFVCVTTDRGITTSFEMVGFGQTPEEADEHLHRGVVAAALRVEP